MDTISFFQQFKNITSSSTNDVYNVIDIPDMPHKLGISPKGYPMFFIVTNDTPFAAQNIELEFLCVEFDLPCTIMMNGTDSKQSYFSLITLRADDVSLQAYFIDIFIMMLKKIVRNPSKRELSVEVEYLIAIFTTLSKPPRKKIQGLWAELLIIERSLHPETLISAWHSQPNAKYDFSMGRDKIEVKSTVSEERIHHFALDQLNPSPNSRLLIASVIVRESAHSETGLSVQELYNKICQKITDNNTRLRLYIIMAETIGNDLVKIDNIFFDYTEASDSLAYYDAKDVPHIEKNTVQPFVSEVKFTSNLTHLVDIQNSESNFERSNSTLFRSLY